MLGGLLLVKLGVNMGAAVGGKMLVVDLSVYIGTDTLSAIASVTVTSVVGTISEWSCWTMWQVWYGREVNMKVVCLASLGRAVPPNIVGPLNRIGFVTLLNVNIPEFTSLKVS